MSIPSTRQPNGTPSQYAEEHTEETPLLLNELKEHDEEHSELTVAAVKTEAKQLLSFAWPISLAYVLQTTLSLGQVVSVGHIGTTELAASSLATMLCNVTGISIGMGMASALDTLCSQAHTGSRDQHSLGRHLQRGIVVMAFLCFPIALLWWHAETLLLLVGQHPEVAKLSGVFTRYALIGLFPSLVNECLKRYLQAQGIMKASLFVIIIAAPINIFLQYLLVWSRFSIGVIGAPIGTALTYCALPILTSLYIRFIDGRQGWGGWDWKEATDLRQIWEFLKLGIPCVAMTCSEWWAFEIVALAAGIVGSPELAAQTIVLNTCSITYVIPLGLSIGASTRIGNALGAMCPKTARIAGWSCILLALIIAVANSTALISVRHSWGYLLSSEEDVVKLVATILPLAAVFQLSDAIGAAAGGILRGCGRPELGAYVNLIG
ncbi:mate-domain-containing protein [Phlyctochytrium arcticum]|nr:mate-domain-containing protein [Phlyctochytrium arcticum]